MFKKGTKLNSIVKGTCPRCQEESMYVSKNIFNIFTVTKMKAYCGSCRLRFMIEPGFFYGAMYVSYGVGIGFGVAAFIVSKLILDATVTTTVLAITGTLLVFYGFIMRVSRNIWINMFVNYDPKAKGRNAKE